MRVLVACETSGHVRDAFIRAGHQAMSADLLPTDVPGPHYQGDVLDILDEGWDMMIAHPPCTYLSSSGLHWNKRVPGRAEKTEAALAFALKLWGAKIKKKCMENPIGRLTKVMRQMGAYVQIVQPYNFGHDASKATGLVLEGLPPLRNTQFIEPRWVDGKPRWGNQTDGGQNKLGPSPDRWKIRSETYTGISDAMANQWGATC